MEGTLTLTSDWNWQRHSLLQALIPLQGKNSDLDFEGKERICCLP